MLPRASFSAMWTLLLIWMTLGFPLGVDGGLWYGVTVIS